MKIGYFIKPETVGGEMYYMIYHRFLFFERFFERWNTPESALKRLDELHIKVPVHNCDDASVCSHCATRINSIKIKALMLQIELDNIKMERLIKEYKSLKS